MGLFDRLFGRNRSDEILGARVLVCALDRKFEGLIGEDAAVYRQVYPATSARVFSTLNELLAALPGAFDVVHLFCEVSPGGSIVGTFSTGADVVQACVNARVALLWVASENEPDGYIAGFPPPDGPMNLVMTLGRKGPNFSSFLHDLTQRMAAGDGIGDAWTDLCPQVPGIEHATTPDMIAGMNRLGLRLRP